MSSTEHPAPSDDGARRRPTADARVCCSTATSHRSPPTSGFRGPVACSAAGITYRQLDYWARTGLVVPEVRGAIGSGSQRLYSFRDILMLEGDQAADRRRHLAAADPHRDRAPARSRRRRPDPGHA